MRMQAAVLEGPRQIKIKAQALQPPPEGSVLVHLEGSGICGSDLPLWQGRSWYRYPQPAGRPGHEGWGIVSALGPGVNSLRIGDRVSGVFEGAFAEASLVPASHVTKLPPRLDGLHFPAEPLACAVNAFRRSGIQAGQTVAIVGVGFVGAILAQLAKRVGAQVVAISRRDYALKVARDAGVQHALPMQEDVVRYVRDLTEGRMCDVVVEATGKQAPLDLAGQLVRQRGRLVIVGYHQGGPRNIDLQTWNWKGIDVVNAHERDPQEYMRGMQEAIRLVARQELNPGPLVTHRFGLEDINDAFALMEQRPEGFLKAILVV